MTTLALIGGNSQVASEVALYLSSMPGATVIPVCRSLAGSAFLRHCGLQCRIGDMGNPDAARQLLDGVDLVADFSRPEGSASEIKSRMRVTLTNLVRQSPPGARIVYISTEMAFGSAMPLADRRYRLLARTTYGATKRYAEGLTRRLARASAKEAYVLRLGQVHGQLQSVSVLMRSIFSGSRPAAMPDTLSDTVFAFTIAEALLHIATGKEKPGVYTLMSTPDWHWQDIYGYYAAECEHPPRLTLYPCTATPAASRGLRSLKAAAGALAYKYREMIGAYALSRFPALEKKAFARYRFANVHRDLAEIDPLDPLGCCSPVVGPIAGRRLATLSDSRLTMREHEERVKAILTDAARKLTPASFA